MSKNQILLLSGFCIFAVFCEQIQAKESSGNKFSKAKPSLSGICGTNNALALSEKTNQSIYKNIAMQVGIYPSKSGCIDEAKVEEGLKEILGNKNLSCNLTLKPNGKIVNVNIDKSSGSEQADSKALEIIKNSADFVGNNFPDNLRWQINFPHLSVRPAWFNSATGQ